MTSQQDPRVTLILNNASRLVTVTVRCAWSLGAAEALNDVLVSASNQDADWHHSVAVLGRDLWMMTAMRVAALLDREPAGRKPDVLSFQTFYHHLKDPAVQASLLEALADLHGDDELSPSRAKRIEQYLHIFRQIDWEVHGRLVHYRNLGIAHLSLVEMSESITLKELQTLVEIVSELARELQNLIQTGTAFHTSMADECKAQVKQVIKQRP